MSFHSLNAANALIPGARLWIIPDISSSKWAQKIDWYLNFQLKKASTHQLLPLSNDLLRIVSSTGCDLYQFKIKKSAPLMISSHQFLPNEATVQIPYAGDLAWWVDKCQQIWSQLGSPQLRLFIPEKASLSQLKKLWPDKDIPEISIVSEG